MSKSTHFYAMDEKRLEIANKLQSFLDSNGLSYHDIQRKIKKDYQRVAGYCKGVKIPNDFVLAFTEAYHASKGAVFGQHQPESGNAQAEPSAPILGALIASVREIKEKCNQLEARLLSVEKMAHVQGAAITKAQKDREAAELRGQIKKREATPNSRLGGASGTREQNRASA